ncbi:hypothetical protein QJS66_23115 [Kocuria rhizophila]|nr:hypothetical protein QJS66_23115 [Kocuria rhizophila]
MSLLGGVMIAAVDTSGNPSPGVAREPHLADDVRKNAAKVSKDTKKKLTEAEKAVQNAVSF